MKKIQLVDFLLVLFAFIFVVSFRFNLFIKDDITLIYAEFSFKLLFIFVVLYYIKPLFKDTYKKKASLSDLVFLPFTYICQYFAKVNRNWWKNTSHLLIKLYETLFEKTIIRIWYRACSNVCFWKQCDSLCNSFLIFIVVNLSENILSTKLHSELRKS